MVRFLFRVFVLCCLLAVVPPQLRAECPSGAYVVPVEPGRDSQPIDKSLLLAAAPGFQILGFSQPSTGVVLESADSFSYKPSSQFWTLGTDSFTVHLAPSQGRSTQDSVRARTVFLVSALGPTESLAESFEGDLGSAWISQDTTGQLQLFSHEALSGQQSLKIVGRPAGSWISTLLGVDSLGGGGQQGSGAQATFRPPGSGGPPGNFGDPYEIAFFSAGKVGEPDYRLWLRDSGASLAIRAELPGVAFTPWIAISRSVHRFRLTRWKGSANGDREGGAFLWLDGALAAELTAPAVEGVYPVFRFGSLGADAMGETGPEIALDLDDVYVFLSNLERPSSLCLAADGFEGRQIGSGWTIPPGFSATAAAALDGSSGLQVKVEEATHLMAISTPTQSGRYGVRFRLDPNTVNLSTGGQLLLFQAVAANGRKPISLLLEPAPSGYRLRALSEDNSGFFHSTPLRPLSDEPHTLAVDWQRAAGERAPTGSLRLWIDGTLAGELTGLASVGQEVAGAYLGGLPLVGTGSGVVYFDQFEAWRGVP